MGQIFYNVDIYKKEDQNMLTKCTSRKIPEQSWFAIHCQIAEPEYSLGILY